MYKKILKYLILFFLVLLQASNFTQNTLNLFEKTVKPDFVITFIIFISLSSSFILTETIGFFSGLLLDILSNSIIGINTFTLTVTASILNIFKTKIFINKSFSIFIIIFFTSLFYRLLFFLLTVLFDKTLPFYTTVIKIVLPEALYTAIIGIILFPIYNYTFRKNKY